MHTTKIMVKIIWEFRQNCQRSWPISHCTFLILTPIGFSRILRSKNSFSSSIQTNKLFWKKSRNPSLFFIFFSEVTILRMLIDPEWGIHGYMGYIFLMCIFARENQRRNVLWKHVAYLLCFAYSSRTHKFMLLTHGNLNYISTFLLISHRFPGGSGQRKS